MTKKKTWPKRNCAHKRPPSKCIIHVKTFNLSDFVRLPELKNPQKRFVEYGITVQRNYLVLLKKDKMCVNKFRQSLVIMMAIIGAAINGLR